jgi:hypothetical protein
LTRRWLRDRPAVRRFPLGAVEIACRRRGAIFDQEDHKQVRRRARYETQPGSRAGCQEMLGMPACEVRGCCPRTDRMGARRLAGQGRWAVCCLRQGAGRRRGERGLGWDVISASTLSGRGACAVHAAWASVHIRKGVYVTWLEFSFHPSYGRLLQRLATLNASPASCIRLRTCAGCSYVAPAEPQGDSTC